MITGNKRSRLLRDFQISTKLDKVTTKVMAAISLLKVTD